MKSITILFSWFALAAVATMGGCTCSGAPASAGVDAGAGAPSPAETSAAPIGINASAADVNKVMNPKRQAPYAGPVGRVLGRVTMTGDPPPDTSFTFPADCAEAAATYRKLFRVGGDGALADALVAVTGYGNKYVPARAAVQSVTLHGCALSTRTLAIAFGQRIEVTNKDPMRSYMPYLDGSKYSAIMVAVPLSDAVRLYPQQPGHYMLRDMMPNPFMTANVFALAYATHAVTGLDGKYVIEGVPVGKARIDAALPVTASAAGKAIDVKEGDNVVDLELHFDASKDIKKEPPAPTPSGAPSAAPPR